MVLENDTKVEKDKLLKVERWNYLIMGHNLVMELSDDNLKWLTSTW